MTKFVLVPGGWHGGWAFDAVSSALADRGHPDVEAVTLEGLGDAPAPGANLASHIGQVVDALRAGGAPAVLAGHSYAGMVITGAADRVPSLVKAIVYIDAYVPQDGDSVWTLTSQNYRDRFIAGVGGDGLNCVPAAHMDRRCRPHPMAAFLQAIRLTGDWRRVRTKAYLAAFGWDNSPFRTLYEQLRQDPQWLTHRFECAHDIPRLAPDALAEILLDCARR